MTKTELKENITKIKQILQSESYEAGFELLRTKNDPALNEELSDLIQSTVKERYFEQDNVDEGLDLLRILCPTLTNLDLSGTDVEELDLTKFISLQKLNLSYCNELQTVKGLERLDKLTSLNCAFSSSLIDLDVYELELLPDVIGLRTKSGMHYGGNIQASEETWLEYLDEFFSDVEIGMKEQLEIIYKDNPFYAFPREFLYQRQSEIDYFLNRDIAAKMYFDEEAITKKNFQFINNSPYSLKLIGMH